MKCAYSTFYSSGGGLYADSYATDSPELCQAVEDVEALHQHGNEPIMLKQLSVRLPKDEEDNACFEHRVFGWPLLANMKNGRSVGFHFSCWRGAANETRNAPSRHCLEAQKD